MKTPLYWIYNNQGYDPTFGRHFHWVVLNRRTYFNGIQTFIDSVYYFIYSFSITERGPNGCKCFYPAMSSKFCHHCLRNNPIDFGNFGCFTRQYTCLKGQTCVQIKLVYNSAPIMHAARPRAIWYQHFIAKACILYVSNSLTSKNANILKTIKSFASRCYLFKRPFFFYLWLS